MFFWNFEPLAAGIADFTIDNLNESVYEESELMLTNNSQHAVSYLWDFGNGDTSTEEDPTYIFERHGVYNISLTTTDKNGDQDIIEKEIIVIF